jgi:4-hydroxy-tetrahydrodipicolinate synthase
MPFRTKFIGTGVALVTPFTAQGAIDWAALERCIEHVIDGGVEYIVSLGTTGEAITLSGAECREVFEFTKLKNNGRVPLVAGLFGSNNTETILERFRNYNLEGFDAILSSSPAYNKPSQEGIYQHYMRMGEVAPLPIIIYNVPGRTGSNVNASTIARIAQGNELFFAVKEASGNMVQGAEILKQAPKNFLVLSGDDPTALPLIGLGGHGVISVIANAYPRAFSDMIRAAINLNFVDARKLNLALLDVHNWLYVENNPCGIKAAMNILDICEKYVRLPLVPQSDVNHEHLKTEMMRVKAALKNI